MSLSQWILNLGLLAWVLLRNLGTRPVQRSSFVTPLLVVAVGAIALLRDLPTAGQDLALEVVGALTGVALGVLATELTRFSHRGERLVVTAGTAFAALWVIVIGGRIAFAEWATGSGARAVGEFSMQHRITGADAWTAAFVLMALAMVLTRVATTAAAARAAQRSVRRADAAAQASPSAPTPAGLAA
jgi:hypothetical protein